MTTNVTHRTAYQRLTDPIDIPTAVGIGFQREVKRGVEEGTKIMIKTALAAAPVFASAASASAITFASMSTPAQVATVGAAVACCNHCCGSCEVQ